MSNGKKGNYTNTVHLLHTKLTNLATVQMIFLFDTLKHLRNINLTFGCMWDLKLYTELHEMKSVKRCPIPRMTRLTLPIS